MCRRGVALLVFLISLTFGTQACAKDFKPPAGFNGHSWGEAVTASHGLTLWWANTVLDSNGKVVEFYFCGFGEPGCNPGGYYQRVEGDGSFAAGEYYFDHDSNPWANQQVELRTISYLYCARWGGDYMPTPIKQHLKLCGAHVTFRSDTEEQLTRRPVENLSNFDRILNQLIVEYGEPPGFERQPRITIESGRDSLATPPRPRPRHLRYRWCGVENRQLRPNCSATVTLALDTMTGEGTVLVAAPLLYDYANAVQFASDRDDNLYMLLNSAPLDRRRVYNKIQCTGRRICQGWHEPLSVKQLQGFKP